ncbi:MAG: ATP-binding protein [Mycoplasma sp.]|nr:ATP-binding protein [Mycoplasma sp.]
MTNKIKEVIEIIEKLNNEQSQLFIKLLKKSGFSKKDINFVEKTYAGKNNRIFALNNSSKNIIFQNVYSREIQKVDYLLNNKKLIEKVGGIKIILHGESGTGKTTLANHFIKIIGEDKAINVNFEELISHKMGQTQINIMKLANDINIWKSNDLKILFLDEIDSIVTKREKNNDIGEHSRIVSTFIKFMDALDNDVIFIAATNVLNSIDNAILRRFNVNIVGKNISLDNVLKILIDEGYEISQRQFKNLIDKFNDEKIFNISEINSFINDYEIEKGINVDIDLYAFFIVYFKEKLKIDFDNLSQRISAKVKKVVKNEKV